jgi:hypothetical protein
MADRRLQIHCRIAEGGLLNIAEAAQFNWQYSAIVHLPSAMNQQSAI